MEAQGLRKSDRVVRSLATAGGRTCARPGCPAPAQATLVFAYEAREARLGALLPERDPATYDLCTGHADRTSPPFGWSMSDQRPPDPDTSPVDLADEDRTVAVISAALRAVPAGPGPQAVRAADEASTAGPAAEAPIAVQTPAPQPREVLAARERAAPDEDAADDGDVAVLTEALEQIAGAEVEVALAELDGLAQAEAADVTVDVTAADAAPTLPFDEPSQPIATDAVAVLDDDVAAADPDGLDVDDWDEDAPLTPEGHAQAW